MKSYFGSYFISPGAEPVESSVLVFDKKMSIGFRNPDGSNGIVHWPLTEVVVSYELSTQRTQVRHTGLGAELYMEGKEAAAFIKEMQDDLQRPWHKKNNSKDWGRNLLLLSGFLGGLVLLYFLIVPWLAEKMASTVSVKTERQLGDAVYDAMGLSAAEDTAASFLLNEFFATMEVPSAYSVRITVVNDNVVNAFAVPGGRIVVYSALLKQIQSYPELAALLSHEFIHVNSKHSTKSIFRRLGSKVFIGLLFGSFGSVTSVLIDHADDLKSLTYSRKLEKEADIKGLEILLQRKIDPKGFEDLFHHLKEASPASALPEFLGSHPDVEKRISYIKESSKNATIAVDQQLQSIFEKIKQ